MRLVVHAVGLTRPLVQVEEQTRCTVDALLSSSAVSGLDDVCAMVLSS